MVELDFSPHIESLRKAFHNNADVLYIIERVYTHFNEDSKKTYHWFISDNTMLGNVSPFDMIFLDRVDLLKTFVDYNLSLNNI
jgi:hypothetical protein